MHLFLAFLIEFIITLRKLLPASAKIELTVLFHQSHMSCCMETGNCMNRTLGFSCHCRNTASVLHHQGVPLSPLPLRVPLFCGTACLYHCKVKAFLKNCWKIWWREGEESHPKTGFCSHCAASLLPMCWRVSCLMVNKFQNDIPTVFAGVAFFAFLNFQI